ncbi:MAG: hypothetical protein D6805_07705 [Planctomycetota bacterium]|nr:MAG: hypothetical protein D6805_07705 [Planctomycetota bacterium]
MHSNTKECFPSAASFSFQTLGLITKNHPGFLLKKIFALPGLERYFFYIHRGAYANLEAARISIPSGVSYELYSYRYSYQIISRLLWSSSRFSRLALFHVGYPVKKFLIQAYILAKILDKAVVIYYLPFEDSEHFKSVVISPYASYGGLFFCLFSIFLASEIYFDKSGEIGLGRSYFQVFFAWLFYPFLPLVKNPSLTVEMARREISERYAGQVLGVFWALGHPLILMSVYVFIFTFVFKVKVGGSREFPLDYTVYLLSGIIPWLAVQDAMNRVTCAVVDNANLVKQLIIPQEVLPAKVIFSVLFTQMISTCVLVGYVLLRYGYVHSTYWLLPVLFFFEFIFLFGLGLFLSGVQVFFRDLKDLVQVFTTVGMYIAPIFYLPQWVPGPFQPILLANPFSHLIWCFQDVFYYGGFYHPVSWGVFMGISLLAFYGGFYVFSRLKVMFGNVL